MEISSLFRQGYCKNGKSSGDNAKNSCGTKTVNSHLGEIELNPPRDRKSEFEPKVVKKRQSDISGLEEIKLMAELLNDHMLARHEDETGIDINTPKNFLNESDKSKTKQKYSVYYIYILIRFLSKLLTELEYKGNFYPNLREFFWIFEIEDKSVILRRKTWDIYHL